MDIKYAAWAASLVAMGWLIPVGVWRALAYRSGQVDHTPGMRMVAIIALGLGLLAALSFIGLTIAIVTTA